MITSIVVDVVCSWSVCSSDSDSSTGSWWLYFSIRSNRNLRTTISPFLHLLPALCRSTYVRSSLNLLTLLLALCIRTCKKSFSYRAVVSLVVLKDVPLFRSLPFQYPGCVSSASYTFPYDRHLVQVSESCKDLSSEDTYPWWWCSLFVKSGERQPSC